MNQEAYKKIEAYLGGSMTPKEITLFENEIEKDVALRKELKLYEKLNFYLGDKDLNATLTDSEYIQNIKQVLRENNTKTIKNRLKNIGNQYHQQRKFTNKKVFFNIAAAVFVLFITSVYITKQMTDSSLNGLYERYYDINDLPALINRNSSNNSLAKGIGFFEDKKYEEALKVFENYQDSILQLDNQVQMYIGVLFLETDKNDSAIKIFDTVIKSNELNNSKGLWFKAMAYMKNNDLEKTRLTLGLITENTNNFKYKEAKELLKKIR